MKSFKIEDIRSHLGGNFEIIGEKNDIEFDNFAPLNESNISSLSWLRFGVINRNEILNRSKANIIICDLREEIKPEDSLSEKVFIKVNNPRLVFSRIIKLLNAEEIEYSIHSTATVHKNAVIGKNVHIGPNCVIGNCTIGDNTIIYGNVFIFDKVTIGKNVTIMPNTTVGGVGFGYEKNENGEFELFPHIGGVIIEDFVDIGASTCIDRGTLGNTIIGRGTKVDNLVHIAHNVKIGENCAIIAHAMIGGSTIIKSNSWVAPSTALREGISIGANATVGLGAVVLKSIPDNEVWVGNPAKLFMPKK